MNKQVLTKLLLIMMPLLSDARCLENPYVVASGVFEVVAKGKATISCEIVNQGKIKEIVPKMQSLEAPGCVVDLKVVKSDMKLSNVIKVYLDRNDCDVKIGDRLSLSLHDKQNYCCHQMESAGGQLPKCQVKPSRGFIQDIYEIHVVCGRSDVDWLTKRSLKRIR